MQFEVEPTFQEPLVDVLRRLEKKLSKKYRFEDGFDIELETARDTETSKYLAVYQGMHQGFYVKLQQKDSESQTVIISVNHYSRMMKLGEEGAAGILALAGGIGFLVGLVNIFGQWLPVVNIGRGKLFALVNLIVYIAVPILVVAPLAFAIYGTSVLLTRLGGHKRDPRELHKIADMIEDQFEFGPDKPNKEK